MDDLETDAARVAKEYLRLGGTRRAKIDDDIVGVRQWKDEPTEASAFWDANIAPLPDRRRAEIETLLPTINSD